MEKLRTDLWPGSSCSLGRPLSSGSPRRLRLQTRNRNRSPHHPPVPKEERSSIRSWMLEKNYWWRRAADEELTPPMAQSSSSDMVTLRLFRVLYGSP